ncbi:hypothetical protein CspHIS471_0501220 [Cutaneotrichosporon sp. HIS471]|nr:hypothetical protein CspHIS471_0501220 [Cutaneotrichosporon sp. HIS471]
MTNFLFVVLAALAATANASPVCRPKPSKSDNPGMPSPSASPTGSEDTTAAPSVSVSVSVSASPSIIPPPMSSGSPGVSSSPIPSASASAPAASSSVSVPAGPGHSTPVAPPGTDKSKPWLPVDPKNNTITANPTPADISGSSEIASWLLQYTNTVRAQYGSAPVTWDASLAQKSADWTKNCNWEHQGDDNLSTMSSANPGFAASALLDMWTNEWPQTFAGGDAVNGKVVTVNHLTEMVWKDTTSIGCSWNLGCKGGTFGSWDNSIFLSCKYAPAGNIFGHEGEQVGNFIPG